MLDIAAWSAKELSSRGQWCVSSGRLEGMSWMVAVLVALVATNAEVEVFTVEASDEIAIWEFWLGISTISAVCCKEAYL